MMDKDDRNLNAMSDVAILETLGTFVKHHRLQQNKSQSQLAEAAGVNRSTLSEFENGNNSNTLTLIQLLRAINQLETLQNFQVKQQLSPLQLAKLEQSKRRRASKTKPSTSPKSDW